MALMLATALGVNAQGKITLKLTDEPLPKALRLIEQQGSKSIIFSVSETEKYKVSADIRDTTQAGAINHVLWGKPFVAKERPECLVIQRKKDRDASLGIAGMVIDEKGEPVSNCNVQVFTMDSVYVNGATTDEVGRFSIPLKRDEEYRMQVSYIGYKTTYKQCHLGHIGTIVMSHESMRLGEVKVTGTRAEAEEKSDNLRTASIRRNQVVEAIPTINIVKISTNKKSFALVGLANVVRKEAYGLQIGGFYNVIQKKVYGLQIGGLYNHVGDIGRGVAIAGLANTTLGSYYGAQIGGLWNYIALDTKGLMIGGLGNWVNSEFDGLQIGGLANITRDARAIQIAGLTNISKDVYGLQMGGLTNITQDIYGLQLAGLFNVSHDLYGMQLAGLFNCAKNVYGLQFAGLVNVAKQAKGVQFATILNVAEESDFPIGLINIIKQGDKGVAFTYDMLGNAVMSFRSGGKYTYGILGVGYNTQIEERLVVEAGYGLQIPICRWLNINNEFKATTMGYNSGYMRSNFSYLLAPSLTLWRHCNLFAGPSINYFMSDRASAATLLPNAGLWRKEGDRGIGQLYLGYQVGVQYVF